MNSFTTLGLSPALVEVLTSMGFEQPTPVQDMAIPMLLNPEPHDFIGLAQTGTGKTAAFGLPLVEKLDTNNSATQALILAPTRELAQQIAAQLESFSKHLPAFSQQVVFGGAAITPQIKALRKPTQLVVATPGRLLDLIQRKAVRLDEVQYVILDEADEMLNMGFKEDLDKILSFTPEHRVTWLFSATMPKDIRKLVDKYMDDPMEVTINREEKTNKDITHQYVVTKRADKLAALQRFLDLQPTARGILFCRTKWETQQIADELGNLGYGAEALHGDLTQAQRDAAMKRFKGRNLQLLVATDVAARGIDVDNLTHVFHHTLPDQLESYTHRSGRTGRAGNKGISLAFINPREGRRVSELEKMLDVRFEKVEVPRQEEIQQKRLQHWVDQFLKTDPSAEAERLTAEVFGRMAYLSAEEVIQKLFTQLLDQGTLPKSIAADLNAGGKGTRESHTMVAAEGDDQYHRYFINVGGIDGLTKGELLQFLSEVSGVKRKHFGQITLQKKQSFFNVDAEHDKGLADQFNGMEIDGRDIRVNRDDDGVPKKRKVYSKDDRGGTGRSYSRKPSGGGRQGGSKGYNKSPNRKRKD